MIIQTRYRDIPFEELDRACVPESEPVNRVKWARLRGTPVRIYVPAVENVAHFSCAGPFYQIVDEYDAVCPHQAEIGD